MRGTLAELSRTFAGRAKGAICPQARAIPCNDDHRACTLAGLATLAGSLFQTRMHTRDNINKYIVLLLLLLLPHGRDIMERIATRAKPAKVAKVELQVGSRPVSMRWSCDVDTFADLTKVAQFLLK